MGRPKAERGPLGDKKAFTGTLILVLLIAVVVVRWLRNRRRPSAVWVESVAGQPLFSTQAVHVGGVDSLDGPATVSLTPVGLFWCPKGTKHFAVLGISDILTAKLRQDNAEIAVFAFLPCPDQGQDLAVRAAKRALVQKRFILQDAATAQAMHSKLIATLGQTRPRRLAFILNPVSGKKTGQSIYNRTVKPVLSLVENLKVTLLVTTHRGHASQMLKEMDLDSYDGIITMGGDGTFHEVVNGLFARKTKHRLPLGVIPSGSGNGLAKTLCDCDIETAAFVVAKGATAPLDLTKVSISPGAHRVGGDNSAVTEVYSFLHTSYAVVSDVDFESEKFWFLGPLRFNVQAVWRILFPRMYPVDVSFRPAPDTKLPPRMKPDDGGWVHVADNFYWLAAANTPWMANDMLTAPISRLSDGALTILMISTCARLKIAWIFLNADTGAHINSPILETLKSSEVIFKIREHPTRGFRCLLDVDGEPHELTAESHVHMAQLPSALSVFAPPDAAQVARA